MSLSSQALVQVRDLTVAYGVGKRRFEAVKGVSFSVGKEQSVGLVGESGSGKTTVGRSLLRLTPIAGGTVEYDGVDLATLSDRQFRPYRRRMQMIFQDPYSSLNPRLTIRQSLKEALELGAPEAKAEWEDRMAERLRVVGLDPTYLSRHPHEFSGGQRQRIVIARALCVEPEFIVCDEPVSALDVSIQAQVLNLLMDLQEKYHLSYLFISHDLRVVRHFCRQILVMQRGQIVESGAAEEVFDHARHPYTQELLSAIPGRS